jgi:hypothetical protein
MSREFASEDNPVAVWCLSVSGLGDCGHDLSGQSHSVAIVVSSHVVGNYAEERGQRFGPTTNLGAATV